MDATDDSLGPTVEQCERQIAALAGRIDAETESRSAVAKELSSTVASQLAAMRTVLESVGAMRSAVEALSRDVAAVAEKEAVAPALNDDRIAAFADGLRGEIGVVRDALVTIRADVAALQGTVAGTHADVDGVRRDVTQAFDAVETGRGEIARVRTEVTAASSAVTIVEETVERVAGRLTTVNDELVDVRSAVEKLHHQVGEVAECVAGAGAESTTTRADVERMRAELNTISQSLDHLRAELMAERSSANERMASSQQTNTMLHEEVRHLAQRMDEIMSLLAARPDAWSSSPPARDRPVVALVEDSVALFRAAVTSIPGGRLLWALLELPFVTAAAVMRMVRMTAEPDA